MNSNNIVAGRKQRTHVYVQRPKHYGIAGCPCGNSDPEWSEYEGHLWCKWCEKDFVPMHNGIFDGPIGINVAKLLNIDLRQINLTTGHITEAGVLSAGSTEHRLPPHC